MEVIDFHTHIYPEKISAAAVNGVGGFYLMPMACDGTVATLLSKMQTAGIGKSVIHSVATAPRHVPVINRFIVEQQQAHPELIGFGTIHTEMEQPEQVIADIEAAGLHGIKIHPDTQKFHLDDPAFFEICDLFRGRLPLLIHCGDYRYDYSHPTRLVKLLHNFPDLTVIAAHFGGWSMPDLALELLKNEHCYVDCSSSMSITGPVRFKELIRAYGARRVVFGSDFPMWDPVTALEEVQKLGLTDEEFEAILHGNACRILSGGGNP